VFLLVLALCQTNGFSPVADVGGYWASDGLAAHAFWHPSGVRLIGVKGTDKAKLGSALQTDLVLVAAVDFTPPALSDYFRPDTAPSLVTALSQAHSGRAPPIR
jgi:hypothetical protein